LKPIRGSLAATLQSMPQLLSPGLEGGGGAPYSIGHKDFELELNSRAGHAALAANQRLVDMYEPRKGIDIALLAGGVLTLVGVALVVLCVVWALQ
jgi:hypothetical protein